MFSVVGRTYEKPIIKVSGRTSHYLPPLIRAFIKQLDCMLQTTASAFVFSLFHPRQCVREAPLRVGSRESHHQIKVEPTDVVALRLPRATSDLRGWFRKSAKVAVHAVGSTPH